MQVESISVIVPIYNMEKYLGRCIESILSQTYQAIELILIDDGSTDGSLACCRAYAEADSRIKVIHQKNSGVSAARNKGIQNASGAYIAFVDPDDWIEKDMYELLYKQLKVYHTDVCLCDFYRDTKNRSVPKSFEFEEELLNKEKIIDELINNMIGIEDISFKSTYVMGCAWRGLYSKDFIKEHQLSFVEGLSIMEDLVFMVQMLLKCEYAAILHKPLYHYIQNPKSTLHTYNKRMWEDQMIVFNYLEKSVQEAGLENLMRNRLDLRYISMILCTIKNETYIRHSSDFKNTISNIKHICTDDKLKMVLERVSLMPKSENKLLNGKETNKYEKRKKITAAKKKNKRQKV